MKKIVIIIASAFVSASLFSALPVFADTHTDPFKIYYSEPIGAGEKVYKITACYKTKAFAPLRCSEFDDVTNELTQCKEKDGIKVKEGTLVKACLEKPEKYEGAYLKTKTPVPNNLDACKEAADQGFVYVPEWAIVPSDVDPEKLYEVIIKGTIASDLPSDDQINKVEQDGESLVLYRPTACGTYDLLVDPGSGVGKTDDKSDKALEQLKKLKQGSGDAETIANALIGSDGSGCNSNNTRPVEGRSFDVSTPFNDIPLVNCSIQERITGNSGADIFSQYVGALYRWAAGVVGIIAVLVMTFSGVQISMAGGDSAKIDSAKNRIMQSLIGLAILFLSGLILYSINPTFFTGVPPPPPPPVGDFGSPTEQPADSAAA